MKNLLRLSGMERKNGQVDQLAEERDWRSRSGRSSGDQIDGALFGSRNVDCLIKIHVAAMQLGLFYKEHVFS